MLPQNEKDTPQNIQYLKRKDLSFDDPEFNPFSDNLVPKKTHALDPEDQDTVKHGKTLLTQLESTPDLSEGQQNAVKALKKAHNDLIQGGSSRAYVDKLIADFFKAMANTIELLGKNPLKMTNEKITNTIKSLREKSRKYLEKSMTHPTQNNTPNIKKPGHTL